MINEEELKQEELKLRQKQLEIDRLKFEKIEAEELIKKENAKKANEKNVKEIDSTLRWVKIGGASLIVYVIFLLFQCDSNTKVDKTANYIIDSRVYTESYIRDLLKSPSSADFGYADVEEISEGNYHISNYVDSENSFGAKIRMKYECDIKFSGGKYTISNVETY